MALVEAEISTYRQMQADYTKTKQW